MNTAELAKQLSEIDALETWAGRCSAIDKWDRLEVFKVAEKLWLERMAESRKLLLHPGVLDQLRSQSWETNDIHKRMIWASVLASVEGSDSKVRFKTIKNLLLNKYGRDWWEDVYERKTNAWAAKKRIRKQTALHGSAMNTLINNTHLFSEAAEEERELALRMISKV